MMTFLLSICLAPEIVQPIQTASRHRPAIYVNAGTGRVEIDRELIVKRDFERSFNGLGEALVNFTKAYNAGAGNVWPYKEAQVLEKALRELRKTETWRPVTRSE